MGTGDAASRLPALYIADDDEEEEQASKHHHRTGT